MAAFEENAQIHYRIDVAGLRLSRVPDDGAAKISAFAALLSEVICEREISRCLDEPTPFGSSRINNIILVVDGAVERKGPRGARSLSRYPWIGCDAPRFSAASLACFLHVALIEVKAVRADNSDEMAEAPRDLASRSPWLGLRSAFPANTECLDHTGGRRQLEARTVHQCSECTRFRRRSRCP